MHIFLENRKHIWELFYFLGIRIECSAYKKKMRTGSTMQYIALGIHEEVLQSLVADKYSVD